jgi:ligand-binding sensor domain-containing protein/signal transduction histidine kinase
MQPERALPIAPPVAGKPHLPATPCRGWFTALICALAVVGVLPGRAHALDPDRRLTQCLRRIWQVQQGLPQATICCIRQTADGYLWLGTQTGLVRFDGVRFTSIRSRGGVSLENLWIRDLCQDAAGRLWVATDGAGLIRLADASARRYGQPEGLPSENIRAAICDRRGRLWVATDRGLARLEDDRFVLIPPEPLLPGADLTGAQPPRAQASGSEVLAVCEARDGTIWAAGPGNRLRSWDGTHWAIHPLSQLSAEVSIAAILATDDGTIWAGSSEGLIRYSQGRAQLLTTADGLANDQVETLSQGHHGVLWVGTKDGFSRLRRGEVESFHSRDGLSQSTVYTLCEDREGSLWVGTKHGLNEFVDRRTIPFTTSEGLPSNNTGPVLEDRAGIVWVGTLDAGLARYDGRRFSAVTKAQGLASNRVLALASDAEGQLWAGTDRGLCRLEGGRVAQTFTAREGLPSDTVRAICRDEQGALWVGTTAGLAELRGDRFVAPAAQPSSPPLSIEALVSGRWGLLAAARGGILYRCANRQVGQFSYAGLASHDVDAFYKDADGLLWMGTRGSGLLRFDGKKAFRYTVKDGLYDDDIFGIIADDRDNLWMACSKGIFSVSRAQLRQLATGEIHGLASVPFSPTDALRTVECTEGVQPGVWRMHDGRIWFSTIRGLLLIDPGHLQRVLPPTAVLVEDMIVNGQSLGKQPAVSLPPGQTNIEFRYTALSFVSAARISFRYQLEGFDRDWIEAGSRRSAFYTNLPPGKYRFRVAARGVDGLDNEAASPVAFGVRPHFYQRPWFIPLICALAALLTWAGVQLRVRQVKRGMRAVLAERTRIARELHDTLMQGFSGVTMEMQALAARLPESHERQTLAEIIRDAGVCLREARHSLMGLRTARSEPSGLSIDIARAARQMTDAQHVRLKLQLADTPRSLSPDVQYNLLRIAQEAVSNAVKHARASSIEVALDCTPGELSLSVKDDGVGVASHDGNGADAGHYGIVGMRERAGDIGARFQLASQPGQGTTVSVSLPLPAAGGAAAAEKVDG